MKKNGFLCAFSLFSLLVLVILYATKPEAAVNQVDGQVVPISTTTNCPGALDSCIQTGLNYGEGINPPASASPLPGPIDAVLDANTGPETFLVPQSPGPGGTLIYNTVTFRLLQEGAGFENIFGWYNVSDPSLRYPVIFSCRDATGNGVSDSSLYEGPYYQGGLLVGEYQVTIDFQREHETNRYLGGQIGFYLVTPEGSDNRNAGGDRNNCATDPDDQGVLELQDGVWVPSGPIDDDAYNGTSDLEGFGRIYYTENKLNNDGNYVHYLIYQSHANPDHYYFGFEDLFRGGDNDFEDTLVKVEGLVPECQPTQEICNGVDDNCNGLIDENVFADCSTACGEGLARCQFVNDGNPATNWVDCTAPRRTDEDCNGLDDDCDGIIDNNLPPGDPCVRNGCVGQFVCVSGAWQCQAPDPTPEICDGLDNNCNGQIDEGVTRPCSTICGVGVERCVFVDDGNPESNWRDCTAPIPGTEICNGIDDDCDGIIDNKLPPGVPCAVSGCIGERVCVDGDWVCNAPAPTLELCDGVDNNCNGEIDEGLFRPCFSECGPGVERCEFVDDGNPETNWRDCTAPLPEPEICDGIDNDCDGIVDNNVPGEGEPCDHPSGITCEPGTIRCVGGELICVGATLGSPEICDCIDNNCNGEIDEGNLCPPGTECVECGCRVPCGDIEFGCPQGYLCKNDFCIPDKCANIICDDGLACVDGLCVDLCAGVVCRQGETCRAGSCVEDSCYGIGCPAGQVCLDGRCVPDPCADVTCSTGEFCKQGICTPSCGAVLCGEGARCVDGRCLSDPCAGVTCSAGIRCLEGRCDTACEGVFCAAGRICELGQCIDNACVGVRCFDPLEQCLHGQCVSPSTFIGQRSEIVAAGGGGYSCQLGRGGAPPWCLVGLLVVFFFWRRGRR